MQSLLNKYYFSSHSLLDKLSNEEKKRLLDKAKKIIFKKKSVIYQEQSYPKGIYIMLKGAVKIYHTGYNGSVQIVYFYIKGDVFGYRPILSHQKQPVTAEALEETTVLFVPKLQFLQLLKSSPSFASLLLQELSNEFSAWTNLFSAFGNKGLMERTALALLILNERFNMHKLKNKNEVSISRLDLANYIGTSVEPLVRTLKKLKLNNCIKTNNRKIILLNSKKLHHLAEH